MTTTRASITVSCHIFVFSSSHMRRMQKHIQPHISVIVACFHSRVSFRISFKTSSYTKR